MANSGEPAGGSEALESQCLTPGAAESFAEHGCRQIAENLVPPGSLKEFQVLFCRRGRVYELSLAGKGYPEACFTDDQVRGETVAQQLDAYLVEDLFDIPAVCPQAQPRCALERIEADRHPLEKMDG